MRLGVKRVALLQRLPQRLISHDDGIDHAVFVEGKLILAQNAELFGARNRALGRLDFARSGFSSKWIFRRRSGR